MNLLINHASSPEDKVAIFRSLFRGREDVYPRRYENLKTGKSGYQPACANEWIRGLCDKRKVKCIECPNRRFLPITDELICQHLSGRDEIGRDFVMGVYPMLLDETCFFLAIDFDKVNWREDTSAFLETCQRMKVPAVLERSRSGNGGHIWLFFERVIPATLARKLGSHLLTETMEHRPDVGLHSYDRFFPNQDTLPKGGFGNLIALPLQKKPRELGNTVFLDDDFTPYPDQWSFLSMVRKINPCEVEHIVRNAENKGRIVGVSFSLPDDDMGQPWNMPHSCRRKEPPINGPLPKSLELVFSDQIYIAKNMLPAGLRNRLLRLAAFQNPEFYKAQAMRLPTYNKPRIIACAENFPHYIGLPRGCLDDVEKLLSGLKIKPVIRDERYPGKPVDMTFNGQLKSEQETAAHALIAHDTGVLAAATAFGKTIIAAWLIAQRGVNTLILVHRRQLLEQWIERLSTFLQIPTKHIGRIGGSRKKPTGMLDVAIIQSLVHKGVVDDRVSEYGHLVIDECHHLSAYSFEQVVRHAKAKYVTGLSATVIRKDGHHPIIFMQCGPVRYRTDAKEQTISRPFVHTVLVRPTAFRQKETTAVDVRTQFYKLYRELVLDDSRNQLICEDVCQAIHEGRSPIVLTERTEHLDILVRQLSGKIHHLIVLRGGMGAKKLKAITAQLEAIPEEEPRVLLATGRYIGEGFDDARLDSLFLTLPVSWRGTIAQYVGRLHRLNNRKREVRVYDYADLNVDMLAKMFDRRCREYEALGYVILLPASAVPGWPAEVPLPVDPEWKKDYAASVRRLVLDGVDVPLANLLVHAAQPVPIEINDNNVARSASEAFLYKRLETLSATAGKFHLNVKLPIPFDGTGKMEVDLLCNQARLVVELDGAQHLTDPEAYRRDRRKDALLQENGYFVLRFLAEDVGKHLDNVLDSILRTLTCRSKEL